MYRYTPRNLLYVNEDNSFVMSNNIRWELRSHVTCRDMNVMYYLECNICEHKVTYIGKTVDRNVVGFKSRIDQRNSDCRTGISTCKFLIHVYHFAMKSKCLKEPYFQLNIIMKLKGSRRLEFSSLQLESTIKITFIKKAMILLTVQSI